MGLLKRLLCFCCLTRNKSRRTSKVHPCTPDENQQPGLEKSCATVQHDRKGRSRQLSTSEDLQVTIDPEMPTESQTQNDVNETASWNQYDIEETEVEIQPDLEKLQHNIQDVIKITADKLQQSLRELHSKVKGELDEMDRKIQCSPPDRQEEILLNNLHRESENILGCLAELVTRVQHDFDQAAAKIQSDLNNVTASVQCEPKETAAWCQHCHEMFGVHIRHDLKAPTDESQQDLIGSTEQILKDPQELVAELQFSQTEVTRDNLDEEGEQSQLQLKTIGRSHEFSLDEPCEKRESAEKKVPECESEQEEQAAVGEIELEIETTAPHCQLRERTGSHISEESFEFHRVLGRGGFGKVMLAELKASGEYYAIKIMKKASFLEYENLDSLRTERGVLMLAKDCPFLSHMYCTFQTEDQVFMVMEFINGGTLHFHLEQQRYFDLASVRFFAAEIICGLQFLHRNGVIYRDLKLENVMLDRDGHIKLVDFGLSKVNMFGDSRTDTYCGTPLYMAPEIYLGQKYSAAVDWWAFGVLLFHLVTGSSPFPGIHEDELWQSISCYTPKYPNWVTCLTKDLLRKLLQKDPDCRLGACGDIRAHQFFKPIDWARIERRKAKPPYKPKLKNRHDCRNFEDETPEVSQGGSLCSGPMDQSAFFGFSFMNSEFTAHIGY